MSLIHRLAVDVRVRRRDQQPVALGLDLRERKGSDVLGGKGLWRNGTEGGRVMRHGQTKMTEEKQSGAPADHTST